MAGRAGLQPNKGWKAGILSLGTLLTKKGRATEGSVESLLETASPRAWVQNRQHYLSKEKFNTKKCQESAHRLWAMLGAGKGKKIHPPPQKGTVWFARRRVQQRRGDKPPETMVKTDLHGGSIKRHAPVALDVGRNKRATKHAANRGPSYPQKA